MCHRLCALIALFQYGLAVVRLEALPAFRLLAVAARARRLGRPWRLVRCIRPRTPAEAAQSSLLEEVDLLLVVGARYLLLPGVYQGIGVGEALVLERDHRLSRPIWHVIRLGPARILHPFVMDGVLECCDRAEQRPIVDALYLLVHHGHHVHQPKSAVLVLHLIVSLELVRARALLLPVVLVPLLPSLLQEFEHAEEGLELKLLPVVPVNLHLVESGCLSHDVELGEDPLLHLQGVKALSQLHFLLEGPVPEVERPGPVPCVVPRANLRLEEAKSLRDLSHLREGLNLLCLAEVLELSSDPGELGCEGRSPLLLQDPELRAFLIGLPLVALCLLPQELRGEDPTRLGGIG